MKKFSARTNGRYGAHDFGDLIKKVEIERETEASVWINGRRTAKHSNHYTYYDSFEDAKKALIAFQVSYVHSLTSRINKANELYFKISALKPRN